MNLTISESDAAPLNLIELSMYHGAMAMTSIHVKPLRIQRRRSGVHAPRAMNSTEKHTTVTSSIINQVCSHASQFSYVTHS